MKFILLFGPPAVGKMTVGLELEKATGIKLFHNHATIELVLPFFDFGTPSFRRLVDSFRKQIFEEVATSDLPGLTFTFVWDLDSESDRAFVAEACSFFEQVDAEIYLIELSASLDQRLIRNRAESRLKAKPSKRDINRSTSNLLHLEEQHRLNTVKEEDLGFPFRHICIESTNLTAEQTAKIILDTLHL